MDHSIDVPHTIIGVACGSSEIAMPLSGLLSSELGFMRMSKQRKDAKVKVITEQMPLLFQYINGNVVVCVDDIVAQGESLRNVLEKTQENGPHLIIGASVKNYRIEVATPCNLEEIFKRPNFHIYSLASNLK